MGSNKVVYICLITYIMVALLSYKGEAQNRRLDSLELLLQKNTTKDSARLDLLINISWLYVTLDGIKIGKYLDELIKLRDSLPQSKLYPKVGVVVGYYYKSIGEFGKCLQSFEDAMQYYEVHRDTLNIIRSLYRLGELNNNTHNYARTFNSQKQYFDKANELLTQFRNDEQSIFINNGMATMYANIGEYKEALVSLLKSKPIYDTIQFAGKERSLGFYNYQLGRAYFFLKEYKKCIVHLTLADEVATKLNNKDLMTEVNFYLAEYYLETKQYEKSEERYKKNLELQADHGNEYLLTSTRQLLTFYQKTNNYKGVEEYLYKCFALQDSVIAEIKNEKYAEFEAKFALKEKEISNEILKKELSLTKSKILYRNIALIIFVVFGVVIIMLFIRLKQTNSNLKSENYQKERLLAVLGHDIRNPLINLLNRLQMMANKKNRTGNGDNEHLAKITQMALSIFRISENIHSYITSKKVASSKLVSDFNIVFEMLFVVEQYEPVAEAKNVALVQHYSGSDQYIVKTDRYAFQTVIRNLIDNAVKYAPDGTEINMYLHHPTDTESRTLVRIVNNIALKDRDDAIASHTQKGLGWVIIGEILRKQHIEYTVHQGSDTYEVLLKL